MKVRGAENVADGLTKHVDRQKMEQYVEACGMARRTTATWRQCASVWGVLPKRALETVCLLETI